MKKKSKYTLLLLILPTLVVVVTVLVLMEWRISTRVQVDLTVNRVVFTVGGTDSTPMLNSVRFQSLTIEKFARIKFSPQKLEVADPTQYIQAKDQYPESAWKSVRITPPIVITSEDTMLRPAVTLEGVKPGLNAVGILDQLWASPGTEVTLELRGAQTITLTIKVDRKESTADLSFLERFQLIITYGRLSGIAALSYRADSLTYRTQLPNHDRFVEITGLPRSLLLILTISPKKTTNLFSKGGIPVTVLDFTRQKFKSKGELEMTLVKDGEIAYSEYPKMDKVSFRAIGLGQLEKFRIEEIALNPEHPGIRLRLSGIAGQIRTGSRDFPRDNRLTQFDRLWRNPQLAVLFSIIVWVFPTTVGGYKLYKEFKD